MNFKKNNVINQIPTPLQHDGFLNLGTWTLPAASLSFVSMCVFLIVVIFLQRNAQIRSMFRFSFDWTSQYTTIPSVIIISSIAALLAWVIVMSCRSRPGSIWPRIWALFLAIFTSSVTMSLYLEVPPAFESLLHALAVACFAATLSLLPRLVRIYPDSPWAERIAPTSLFLVLAIILPIAYFIGKAEVDDQKKWIQVRIDELNKQMINLRGCDETSVGCSISHYQKARSTLLNVINDQALMQNAKELNKKDDIQKAAGELFDITMYRMSNELSQKIRQISLNMRNSSKDANKAKQSMKQLTDFNFNELQELSTIATKLDKLATTKKTNETLANTLALALSDEYAPKITEDPVKYNSNDGPWQSNPDFIVAGKSVIGYFQHMGRLFRELESIVSGQEFTPISEQQPSWRATWDNRKQSMQNSWSNHWLLHYLQDLNQPTDVNELPLSKVLSMSVLDDEQFAPANFARLFEMEKGQIEELLRYKKTSNCEDKGYTTDGKYYYSLRCRAYSPGSELGQLALRAEMRLIYDRNYPLTSSNKPDRIYFIFPVPMGKDAESYKAEIISALDEARSLKGDDPKALGSRSIMGDLAEFTRGQQYIKFVIRNY